LLASDPQHFNWRRLQQHYPATASQAPDEDMEEEGEITPSDQQQELMADIQRRALHGTQTHSSRHSAASNVPKPWEAAGFDATTAGNLALRAQNAPYGDMEMDENDPLTTTDPFAGPSSETDMGREPAGPSTIRTRTPTPPTDIATQLRRLRRAYAAQGAMLEESLSALEIGKDIVAEERTVLFHLSRGVDMRRDPRAVRSGPPSRSVKDVVEKLDQLTEEYRGLVGELRERQDVLGRDVEGLV
jgi:hypothetical protein